MQEQQEKSDIPLPPPILNMNLKIQNKEDLQRKKLINRYGQFQGCLDDEVQSKYKQTEELNPSSMKETEGEGNQDKFINTEGKLQCQRCEGWIPEKQMSSHLDSHSSQILDWLYLGAVRNASNHKELTIRTNIKYILNTAIEVQNYFPEEFTYLKIDLYDQLSQDIFPYLNQGADFINQAEKQGVNILVHCIQGISRSATIVISYLMKYKKQQELILKFEYDLFGKNSCIGTDINPLTKYVSRDCSEFTYTYDPKDKQKYENQ